MKCCGNVNMGILNQEKHLYLNGIKKITSVKRDRLQNLP